MEELKIDHSRRNSYSSDASFVSHRSMDPPPISLKRGVKSSVVKKSRYDAKLINPGPPAVYQLNTVRKYIDGTDQMFRRWTYGQRDTNKRNKVLLMVGETGTGKTTLINTMINYILGVKFENQDWYEITEEEKQEDQTQSQTSEVTVYEVFVEKNPTSLTIIDTPGYTNSKGFEREREIADCLERLFLDKEGVDYIDAVCFVMKASLNELSVKELYIFYAVQSLFGRDIEDNIIFLLTHSDGGLPTDALNAIEKAEIPCRRDEDNQPVHFLFNNRQKEKRNICYEQTYRLAWEMGETNMDALLKSLEDNNRKKITLPNCIKFSRHKAYVPKLMQGITEEGMEVQDVTDREEQNQIASSVIHFGRLEAVVSKLREQIWEKEMKEKELTDIQYALIRNRGKIEKGENFEFSVSKVFNQQVDSWFEATSCTICKETCHSVWGCWWVSADNLSKCDVMNNNYCTVCSWKCHYSKHVKESKQYKKTEILITMTLYDLLRRYQCYAGKRESCMIESGKETEIEKKINRELEKTKTQRASLLNDAYNSFMSLLEVTLEGIDFTPEHVDFFITRMKKEGEYKKIQDLELVKKRIQDHVNTLSRQAKTLLEIANTIVGLLFRQLGNNM